MKKFYQVTGCEKLSKKTNAILAEVKYHKPTGYELRVKAVEVDDYSIGHVYSPEYYNIYYDEVCLLESCKRRGSQAEERANAKAREIVGDIVDKYISRVAVLSGIEPHIVGEEDWRD